MPRVDLILEAQIERTARVVQLEGLFDVPAAEKSRTELHVDAPLDERPWSIGAIVGPSGAGKSSVARHLFPEAIVAGYDWPEARSVIDGFGALPIRETTAALSSVGFSSPPSWLRPFRLLSNGEQFRATMARALVDERPLVVVDEFTSVVDRTVAQIGSYAIAKAVRARIKRFVAVTCHYDVLDWLQPDWVLEPHVGRFTWRGLQRRPSVDVEIVRAEHSAEHSAWRWFAAHHYLSADLSTSARCFAALVRGEPAGFVAVLHWPHPKVRNFQSISRLVVLPDYQGIGLAGILLDFAGGMIRDRGGRTRITTSHPALVASLARSSRWNMTQAPRLGDALRTRNASAKALARSRAFARRTTSFEYVGPSREDARSLWSGKVDVEQGQAPRDEHKRRKRAGVVDQPREQDAPPGASEV